MDFIVQKLQGAITEVEDWSYKLGLKLSVDKIIGSEVKLILYYQEPVRVKLYMFLGFSSNQFTAQAFTQLTRHFDRSTTNTIQKLNMVLQ